MYIPGGLGDRAVKQKQDTPEDLQKAATAVRKTGYSSSSSSSLSLLLTTSLSSSSSSSFSSSLTSVSISTGFGCFI